DYLAEVEGRLVAQPTVEAHQGLRGIADPLATLAQSRHDAAVQKLPERGNADHARYVSVLDCAREFFAVEFGEVGYLRAAADGRQKSRRELERVVERENGEHAVARVHLEDGGEHRDHVR